MKIKPWSGAASLQHKLAIEWHYWKYRKTCFLFGHPHSDYTKLGGYSHVGYWYHLALLFWSAVFLSYLYSMFI